MHRLKLIAVVLICINLTACASATKVYISKRLPSRPVHPRNVAVYLGPPPVKSYPIAMISIARHGSGSVWAVEQLKMEAGEIGADAITNLKIAFDPGMFPVLRAQGVAVKYE